MNEFVATVGLFLLVLAYLFGKKIFPRRQSDQADSDMAVEVQGYYRLNRHPSLIVKEVLKLIPRGEAYNELRRDLNYIEETVRYAAPEDMPRWWLQLNEVLTWHLDTTASPWKDQIMALIQDPDAGKLPQEEC